MNPSTERGPDPAGEVAARLDSLEAELGDLHDIVAERLNHLHPPAAGPTAAVAAMPASGTGGNAAPWRVWWWPALDPEQTVAAWQRLESWVTHALLARHPQHTRALLGCWRAHPGIVDELTALRAAWHHAWTNPAAEATAAADWLAKRLPDTITRISAAFAAAGCRIEGGQVVHDCADHRHHPPAWTEEQITAAHHATTAAGPPIGDL